MYSRYCFPYSKRANSFLKTTFLIGPHIAFLPLCLYTILAKSEIVLHFLNFLNFFNLGKTSTLLSKYDKNIFSFILTNSDK